MANNQEKFHEIIIFYKKNIMLYLFLRNLEILVTFARKVQYNTLLGMKIQEVMKWFVFFSDPDGLPIELYEKNNLN